jgi:hypothetical protein
MARLFHWHGFAQVLKIGATLAALLLSGILSFSYFSSISPAGMAVFPFAALSLTEGGLIVWTLIFTSMKHHRINSLIALVMIIACFVTTVTVTLAELIQLFQDHALINNQIVINGTLILLEIMLGCHLLAAMSDFLIGKIEWLLTEMAQPKEEHVMSSSFDEHLAWAKSLHPEQLEMLRIEATKRQQSGPLAVPELDKANQNGKQ